MEKHPCVFFDTCECSTARNYAAQSSDAGATVSHVWVCDAHVSGWNAQGDWDAPVWVRAADLCEDDYVDLAGDKFADPQGERIEFSTEYVLVAMVERETADCVAIAIDGVDIFGFPPEHLIRLRVD